MWGLAPMLSSVGFRYYIPFIDDFSRYVWIYPLRLKIDTVAAFEHFVKLIKTQFNSGIKPLQPENGGEYKKTH